MFDSTGWYSTGSYFLSKSFVEIIPTIIYSVVFALLSFYWSGQLYETHRLFGFVMIMLLSFICTEGIGHTIGIIFANHVKIAMVLSIGLFAVMALFCNFFIRIKDMPSLLQNISSLAYLKFSYESIIILIYGLNRCSHEQQSVILIKFTLSDQDLSKNYYKLVLYALVLRIFEYIALYTKNNLKLIFNLNIILRQFKKKSNPIEKESPSMIVDMVELRKENPNKFGEEPIQKMNNYHENLVCIGWDKLTFKIPRTFLKNEKIIINEITGCFEFSSLNALMGSSGVGKTSLLKAINGLCPNNLSDETNIYLSQYKRINSCFVTQDQRDRLMTGITVGQAMLYASKLKNSDNSFDHKKNVENLMKQLMIYNAFNTNVEKCSGGEQKRLVIAMELTDNSKPNMICIDEPTSGLDSCSAEVVSSEQKHAFTN